ncbi:MAG: FG-GAP repeat protein [Planctomycetes bacterium]|nr:FG-GAP repeat protein [Planctomycetota bacterium]
MKAIHSIGPAVFFVASVCSLGRAAVAQQAYLKPSSTDTSDWFGSCVAVDGDLAVVGVPFEDSSATGVGGNASDDSATDAGGVFVFRRIGSIWSEEAYLKPSNTDAGDRFGSAVAVSGSTIVVGAPRESSNATGVDGNDADNTESQAGAAYVFVWNGSSWLQQAYLKASNTESGDRFGASVAVDGDSIVVGAYQEDSDADGVGGNDADNSAAASGAAYVYARAGAAWTLQAYLKASNSDAGDLFGSSVGISGDTIVVGAPDEDSATIGVFGNQLDESAPGAGAAYIFRRTGSNWAQQAYVKASNTEASDRFGVSSAISNDTVIVGADLEDGGSAGVNGNDTDNSASNSGAAYVFVRTGPAFWSQQAYIKPSNPGADDWFGNAVALDGDLAVVGAVFEDSSATGLDGDGSDNSQTDSGAAYAFSRCGVHWGQTGYLKASNTDAGDRFASGEFDPVQTISAVGVSVSGDTALIGAPLEDSAATSIGGAQGNDGDNNGAAYVYELDPGIGFVEAVGGGCPGEAAPICLAFPSASQTFSIASPALLNPCAGPVVMMFGTCSPPIPVPPPITCGLCGLAINPSWGTGSATFVVGPGLPIGFQFCVQSACIATAACIELSVAARVTVGL